MSPQKVSTTTARLKKTDPSAKGPNISLIAIAAVVAIVVLALLFSMGDDEEESLPPTPTPTARPAPTPVAQERPTPAPQPWETEASFGGGEPTPTAAASGPAPGAGNPCISFRWTAGLQAGSEEPLDVVVTVQNNCQEDLQSLSLAFEARGFRGGEQILTAQGSVTGSLGPGEATGTTITLPGTPGGFDRVDLQPVGG